MGCCLSSWFSPGAGLDKLFSSGRDQRNGHSGGSCSKVSNVSLPQTPARSQRDILQSSNLKRFSFSELRTATRNFRPDSVLGEGGCGSMFKGWIDEQTLTAARPGTGMVNIAIKRFNNQEGSQGDMEYWLAEINCMRQLYHPNLVKLVGYCLEDEHLLLVYEFLPNGSLENHLFTRSSYDQPLSWKLRIQVALGAAKGLAFLHSDEAKVIYRDFKTSNILLDSNFEAKLSDIALANKDGPTGNKSHFSGDKSHVSTRFMGTFGYVAPEYMAKGRLNRRSDVYSFGVVFLEMLCGKRVLDKNRPSGEHNLIEWAKTHLTSKRKMLLILDSRIQGQYTVRGALTAIKLAIRCISVEPKFRPDMDEVVKALEHLQESEETQGRT